MTEILTHLLMEDGFKWVLTGAQASELVFDELIFRCPGIHDAPYGFEEALTFIYHIDDEHDMDEIIERIGAGVAL